MERLTNSTLKYFNEVKKELTEILLQKNQSLKFTYCEIGLLLTHGFSVSFITGEKYFLKIKKWNANFDNKRFNLNIYNLDRLAVTEKEIELSNIQLAKIEKLFDGKLELKKLDGIVLDGLYCQFETENYCLNWNTDVEMDTELFNLIEFLKNIASR